jgi:hypothetical protein
MTPEYLWHFLPIGYCLTVLIETPVLLLGLSPRHPWRRRLVAGVWLNACSYPVVVLVFPLLFEPATPAYLVVAETFAPVCECALFWLAFGTGAEWLRRSMWRDFGTIVLANLASFGIGEYLYWQGWLGGAG